MPWLSELYCDIQGEPLGNLAPLLATSLFHSSSGRLSGKLRSNRLVIGSCFGWVLVGIPARNAVHFEGTPCTGFQFPDTVAGGAGGGGGGG